MRLIDGVKAGCVLSFNASKWSAFSISVAGRPSRWRIPSPVPRRPRTARRKQVAITFRQYREQFPGELCLAYRAPSRRFAPSGRRQRAALLRQSSS